MVNWSKCYTWLGQLSGIFKSVPFARLLFVLIAFPIVLSTTSGGGHFLHINELGSPPMFYLTLAYLVSGNETLFNHIEKVGLYAVSPSHLYLSLTDYSQSQLLTS